MNYFKVFTDKPPLEYKCGEEMKFKIQAFSDAGIIKHQKILYILSGDDRERKEGLADSDSDGNIIIKASCRVPGFVRLIIKPLRSDCTPDDGFDPCEAGAGANVSDIRYHGNIPADYDEYWAGIRKLISDFSPRLLIAEAYKKGVPEEFECLDFRASAPQGTGTVSGYLTYPKSGGKYPLAVRFKGYGVSGCIEPFFEKNTVCAIINAHGIENGFPPEATAEKYSHLAGYGFDEKENSAPETSYWQGMIIRDLAGVKYLKSLPFWNGRDIKAEGGSQGAFQAVHVAANDRYITELFIEIPWFCDLHAEEYGYQPGWRPKPAKGLEYFDTAAAVMKVRCPVEMRAGLGDYVCPPATTMALYNSASAPKAIEYMQCRKHDFWPRKEFREIFRLEDMG